MGNPVTYTLEELHQDCQHLAQRVKNDDFQPDCILAVTRGGLLPAALIAEYLNVRVVETIGLASYIGTEKQDPLLQFKEAIVNHYKRILVIDDVADTGDTLCYLRKQIQDVNPTTTVRCMTIHYKSHSTVIPDYYQHKTDQWIHYQWEHYDQEIPEGKEEDR